MEVVSTRLPDVKLLKPQVHADERGFFLESYNAKRLADVGIDAVFVQDNHSRSTQGVLRGLHYQIEQAQGKLIRVLSGQIYDVAVDMRRHSEHFGRWTGVELSAEKHLQLWIPPGFAHGFLVMSNIADIFYKTTDYYAPAHERCLRWDDPDVGIEWPVDCAPTLSARDAVGSTLAEADAYP